MLHWECFSLRGGCLDRARWKMSNWIKPLRPQVLFALVLLAAIAMFGDLDSNHFHAIIGAISGAIGTIIALDKGR